MFSLGSQLVLTGVFAFHWVSERGLDFSRAPLLGASCSNVLGIAIFNFALCATVISISLLSHSLLFFYFALCATVISISLLSHSFILRSAPR